MEWRDGKLHVSTEDQADLLGDLCAFAQDGETRAELRRAARETRASAADGSTAPVVLGHVSLGGRGFVRSDSAYAKLRRHAL